MHVPDEPGWRPPNSEYPPPRAGEPPIHHAARIGDDHAIRLLAAAAPCLETMFDLALDPGARPQVATALMVAAGSGDGATADTVRLLLELGADPTRTVDGHSAASFACLGLGWNYRPGGDVHRLLILLDAGSPLPSDPGRSNRLLCAAASAGDPARVALLLEHGLEPAGHFDAEAARQRALDCQAAWSDREGGDAPFASLPDSVRDELESSMRELQAEMLGQQSSAPFNFEIPLFCAAESGSADCLRILLDAGADPLARDNSSRTALYSASTPEVVRLLLDAGVPLEDADTYEWSPLAAAVGDGADALPRVRALLEAGADPNRTHDRGYTVLMGAVGTMERDPTIIDLLLSAGANPHATSELGFNAFHAAIDVNGAANAEDSVRAILRRLHGAGVDLEHRTWSGQTPLARAILEGTAIEVRVLCELGANPNAIYGPPSDPSNRSPILHLAANGLAVHGPEKTEALLRAGADPHARDAAGFTALERNVARLCAGATDYESAYHALYRGLPAPTAPSDRSAAALDSYLESTRPVVREVLDSLASAHQPPAIDEFDSSSRRELLDSAALLLAFAAWRA